MSRRLRPISIAVCALFLAPAALAKSPKQGPVQIVPVKSSTPKAHARTARGPSPKPAANREPKAAPAETLAAEAPAAPAVSAPPVAPPAVAPEKSAISASSSADTPSPARPVGGAHPTAGRMQIQGMLGDGSDSLGVGIGVRAGYTLSEKLYVGGVARTSYYWNPIVSATWVRPGVEAGYDFTAGPVVIRPYAGAGFAFVRASVSVPGLYDSSASTTVGAFLGGAQVFGNIPKTPVFIGGDVHAVVFTSSWGEGSAVPLDFSVLAGTHFP
jgi:hypothetical protein